VNRNLLPKIVALSLAWLLFAGRGASAQEPALDARFEELGNQYLDQFTAYSPVRATALGDHRFDGQLDEISEAAREQHTAWIRRVLEQLDAIDAKQLTRANQVDYGLLRHSLDAELWQLDKLREWQETQFTD
jgi:uncharacterized protein (DUF885 family)